MPALTASIQAGSTTTRHEIGLGEVAIVGSFFLAPLHNGDAARIVPAGGGFGSFTEFLARFPEFFELRCASYFVERSTAAGSCSDSLPRQWVWRQSRRQAAECAR